MVNIKYFRKSNIALALLTLTAIFYYYRLCESIALLEYLNLKYFNNCSFAQIRKLRQL